jgi:ABC transporter related
MEKNVVINLKNVSLLFRLNKEKIDSLKEYFFSFLKRRLDVKEFFAVNNVSFEVKKGESIGIIGMNGSGKSTLLKIIAGILKPSQGTVEVNGQISPMIELGAGFDHELTARENIYLNGILIGFTKKEIDEYFDSIVDFAEIREFLDVPLKNFSSGMLSRLGFAISTVRKPDILIIDEVLAVGDLKFQEKSSKKIKELLEGDTTLLLVSHSLNDIEKFCDKVIWLEKGEIKMMGNTKEICKKYKTI